jgi:LysR family transcriptional regulator, hydrogen peroxide-inducible genes activator
LEIQQARYFLALSETLNFTRAAERCNVTQPSLTRAVKLLEDELGGPLFNRERNNTHLTELGRLIEPHIRELLLQAESARTRAAAFRQLRRARLRIGIVPGLPITPIDSILAAYGAEHRETEIELRRAGSNELVEALQGGGLEVVVLPLTTAPIDEFHFHALCQQQLVLLLPESHELARRPAVLLSELAELPLLCGEGCAFWAWTSGRLAELGLEAQPRVVAGSHAWLPALVAGGLGAALAPATEALWPGLVSRPVIDPPITCTVSLVTKRCRPYSPPVKAFIDLALQRHRAQPTVASAAA